MSKTHYKLDKLVAGSECTLLSRCCCPVCYSAFEGAPRVTTLKSEWSPPSDLGAAENGVRCAPEWRFYCPLFPLSRWAGRQADILYRSIADFYCSTYCVLPFLLFYDDGAIPSSRPGLPGRVGEEGYSLSPPDAPFLEAVKRRKASISVSGVASNGDGISGACGIPFNLIAQDTHFFILHLRRPR